MLQVNDEVAYTPYKGARPEYGKVTEIRDNYVLVRFVGDIHAKTCKPEQLALVRMENNARIE